jgi:hypothetical protein
MPSPLRIPPSATTAVWVHAAPLLYVCASAPAWRHLAGLSRSLPRARGSAKPAGRRLASPSACLAPPLAITHSSVLLPHQAKLSQFSAFNHKSLPLYRLRTHDAMDAMEDDPCADPCACASPPRDCRVAPPRRSRCLPCLHPSETAAELRHTRFNAAAVEGHNPHRSRGGGIVRGGVKGRSRLS